MPANKGVENAASSHSGGTTATSSVAPGSSAMAASAERERERVVRRRTHKHRRHQKLGTRSGKGMEIALLTLFAIAILFSILYYLLPHYNTGGESRLNPEPGRRMERCGRSVKLITSYQARLDGAVAALQPEERKEAPVPAHPNPNKEKDIKRHGDHAARTALWLDVFPA